MTIRYLAFVRLPTEKAHGLQIMKTCEAFARAGHDVELIVPERQNDITEDAFTYYGVERDFVLTKLPAPQYLRLGALGYVLAARAFARRAQAYLRDTRIDVLYSRDERVLAALSARFCRNVSIAWESHTGAWNGAARKAARRAARVVVLTEGARLFYGVRGLPVGKMVVAPDGIDLSAFAEPETKEAARARLGLPPAARIALYVGRLDGWKGSDTFCRAAALLPEQTLAVVIGGEPAQVKALRTAYPHVRFLGFRSYSELANNLAAGDVLVLPNTARDDVSVRFTSPLKLFAYMAASRPIVASDLPSLREVLSEDTAYFVGPDDSHALAAGIERALSDADASVKAARAREAVAAYTWEARAARILAALV